MAERTPLEKLRDMDENSSPIDEQARITVTGNQHTAYIEFTPPSEGGRYLEAEDIYALLEESRVVFGIRSHLIEEWAGNPYKPYHEKLEIAQALLPISGQDAWVEYFFRLHHDRVPQMQADGSVDHKTLHLFDNAGKGDTLARIHPETEGTAGYSVLGARLPARRGKKVALPVGENCEASEDGLAVIARENGHVEFINRRVVVKKVLLIEGDVGASTGDVQFTGDIVIHGSVLSQYSVSASGAIEVGGVIEGANVRARGDIIVRQGIKGKGKCEVVTSGDLTAKFIENATVRADGVIRADVLMHSSVVSNTAVEVMGRRAAINGGWTHGTHSITARDIINTGDGKTLLTTGMNPDIRRRLLAVEKEIDEQKAALDEKAKDFEYRMQLEQKGRPFKTKEMKKKIILRDDHALAAKKMEAEAIREMIQNTRGGFIHVEGELMRGVLLEIGPARMKTEASHEHVTLLREGRRIGVVSLFREEVRRLSRY